MEVKPFGVRIVLIEPGDFRTEMTASRQIAVAAETNPAYRNSFKDSLSAIEHGEINGSDPVLVARLVERITKNPNPRLRYTVGPLGQRLGVGLKKVLPYRLYELLMMRYYDL
jgi:hypothetical protein